MIILLRHPDYLSTRNAKIYERRESGVTYAKIASEFDISIERVRQVYFKEKRLREANKNTPHVQLADGVEMEQT